MNDIGLIDKLSSELRHLHSNKLQLLRNLEIKDEILAAKDKEIVELKANNERLRKAGTNCYDCLSMKDGFEEEAQVFNETPAQSLREIEASAVEMAIKDFKKEYVGQGVEVLLQSFADSLREKS